MRRVTPVLCALALLLAACGGGESTATTAGADEPQENEQSGTQPATDTTDAQSSDSDSSGGGTSGFPPGGTGTVTIDGETIESDWVGNCLIDETFDPHPDDLDLSAGLGSGIDALFLEIYSQDVEAGVMTQFHAEIQRQNADGEYDFYEMTSSYLLAPDGNWYQDDDGALSMQLLTGQDIEVEPMAEGPIVIESDRVSGTVPMQVEGQSEAVDVSFDLNYIDAVDCSL